MSIQTFTVVDAEDGQVLSEHLTEAGRAEHIQKEGWRIVGTLPPTAAGAAYWAWTARQPQRLL